MKSRIFISSKVTIYTSLWVIGLTILLVFVTGIPNHRSLFENSIMSTTLLSLAFFIFISVGLYKGFKLRQDTGALAGSDSSSVLEPNIFPDLPEAPDLDDDIFSAILGIILWLASGVIIILLAWIFSAVVFTSLILFLAMLYWIFFRALRLVFKKSAVCKQNLPKSIGYALLYTALYNFWIYGIIIGMHAIQ